MARAAPHPCPRPGCGRLVPFGERCPVHPGRDNTFADNRRGSRHERGYDTEWDHTRREILQRDRGLCQPCLHGLSFTPTAEVDAVTGLWRKPARVVRGRTVDHKVCKADARRHGWTREQMDDHANLWTVCDACNKVKTGIEARGGGGVGMFSRLLAGPDA